MFTPLYYLSSLAGLVMVVGGIWLLYKQKIYIDSESKQVIEVELPIGKFKTNLPVLVLFALGFVPLIYPLVLCHNMFPLLSLQGSVEGDAFPVQIYTVVRTDSLNQPGDFNLRVPQLENLDQDYKILYVVSGQPPVDYHLDFQKAEKGVLKLPVTKLVSNRPTYKPNALQPVPAEFQWRGKKP